MLKKWYAKVIFFILYSFASYCMMQLFLDANPFTIGVNGIARNMFLFMIYYGVLLWNHIYGFLRYFYGDDRGGAVYR